MSTHSPSGVGLDRLRYEPTEREQKRFRAFHTLVVCLLLVVEVAAVWGLVAGLMSHPWDTTSDLVAFLIVVITITVWAVGRLFAVERLPAIADGMMRLPFSLRTTRGRVREVRLASIRDVVPEPRPGEALGVRVTLDDGSSFYISWNFFGNRGAEVLEALSQAFGRSFEGTIKRRCLEGRPFRFQIARPRAFKGSTLVLRGTIQTYTRSRYLLSNEVRAIDPGQVREIEPVSPSYSGPGYLVTLEDGATCLIRQAEADRLHLFENPAWRSKLRPAPGPWISG